MSKKKSLSQLLYDDPAYSDLVRIVGYGEIRFPLGKAEQDRLLAAHGKEKMIRVANELIEYDPKTKLVKLKAEVRARCQMMLGPPPEEWDAFYANIIHPPPNPYKPKPAGTKSADVTSHESDSLSPETFDDSPSDVEQLRRTHGRTLRKLLLTTHAQLNDTSLDDLARKEALRQSDLLESEMRRRRMKIPERLKAN